MQDELPEAVETLRREVSELRATMAARTRSARWAGLAFVVAAAVVVGPALGVDAGRAVPHSPEKNQVIFASEMAANFDYLANEIDSVEEALNTRMSTLEAELATTTRFVGTARHPQVADCNWRSALDTFDDYDAVPECAAPVLTGSALAPASRVPGVRFQDLAAGTYLVVAHGFATAMTLRDATACDWTVSDGTSVSGRTQRTWFDSSTAHFNQDKNLLGVFTYGTDQTDITFQIQSRNNVQVPNCDVNNTTRDEGGELSFLVLRLE